MIMEGDPTFKHFVDGLFNLLAFSSATLGTWELADAAQLDKHNGKEGTLGIRLILMMDPLGKAYYWLLHGQTRDMQTNFGYGFYTQTSRTSHSGPSRGGGQTETSCCRIHAERKTPFQLRDYST